MIKLNDSNIFIGEIKQLLHTFNLPKCQIGDAYPTPNKLFISKNHIFRWDENLKVIPCERYDFGDEVLNITTTMPINNMIYDRSTHRYLGKYLRFIRDYKNVNLMSMYNCWDGETNLNKLEVDILDSEGVERKVSFKDGDDSCTVYKIPVSIDTFTVSIHYGATVELCVYVDSKDEGKVKDVANLTYTRQRSSKCFTYSPFELITDDSKARFVWENINKIFILMKVSKNITTSPVVLEGTYVDSKTYIQNYFTYKPTYVTTLDKPNTSLLAKVIDVRDPEGKDIINYAQLTAKNGELLLVKPDGAIVANQVLESPYIIASQLLSLENMTGMYLVGDRLLEYITNNAISPLSEYYDIRRVQKALDAIRSHTGISKSSLKQSAERCYKLYGDVIKKNVAMYSSSSDNPRYSGIWHKNDTRDLRAIAQKSGCILNYDTLGYLDKDLEAVLKGVLDNVEV